LREIILAVLIQLVDLSFINDFELCGLATQSMLDPNGKEMRIFIASNSKKKSIDNPAGNFKKVDFLLLMLFFINLSVMY
jgi:hypothetical protein